MDRRRGGAVRGSARDCGDHWWISAPLTLVITAVARRSYGQVVTSDNLARSPTTKALRAAAWRALSGLATCKLCRATRSSPNVGPFNCLAEFVFDLAPFLPSRYSIASTACSGFSRSRGQLRVFLSSTDLHHFTQIVSMLVPSSTKHFAPNVLNNFSASGPSIGRIGYPVLIRSHNYCGTFK